MNSIRIITTLIVFLTVGKAMGQTPDFELDTKVSGPVNVCGDAITFTVTITKLTSSSVQNIKLYPQMPAGMTYVAGTATGMSEVLPVNVVNSSFVITDFTGDKTVTFKGKADCSLITTQQTTGGPSNLINNNTELTYDIGSNTGIHLPEPNGSESYSVLYPELELFVPESEKNMGVPIINSVMNRHITIKNSGLGNLTTFDFYLKTEPELTLEKLELQTSSGTQVINYSTILNLGRKYTINDFTGVGDGDAYFEENEELLLVDYVKANTSKGSIETIYTAQWGCLNTICNLNDNQSTFAAYVEAIGGRPDIKYSQNRVYSDFCNDPPGITIHTFENKGSDNLPATRDAAFNVKWYLYMNGYNTTNDFHISIIKQDNSLQNVDGNLKPPTVSSYTDQNGFTNYSKTYFYDFTDAFNFDPDGPGGLADVDGDGFYDDLPVGAIFKIQAAQKITFNGDVQTFAGQYFLSTANSINYNLWSGELANAGPPGNAYYAPAVLDQDLNGPTDLESGKKEQYKLVINAQEYNLAHKSDDATFEIDINVPDGVTITSAKFNATPLTFTQQGKQIKIINPLWRIITLYSIDLEFQLNCTSFSGNPIDKILLDMYYYSDPACSATRFKIAHLQKDVFLHCGSCPSTETTQFTAERTTLGWIPFGSHYYYKYGQLFGASPSVQRVTRNTPGIRLDAAYPKDEVETTIQGRVATVTSNLKAEIAYTTKLNMEALSYVSASLIVNGITRNLPSKPFGPLIQGGTYTYTYNVPLGDPGWPTQLDAGTVFELKVKYKVDDLSGIALGEYPITNFTGRFFSIVNGAPTGCAGFGDDFSLLRPTFENKMGNYGYTFDKSNKVMVGAIAGSWTNKDHQDVPDFPNEYRPLSYLSSSTVTLPKGFIFDTSKPIEFSPDFYGPNFTFPLATEIVSYSLDKRTVTISLGEKPDNMPLMYRSAFFYGSVLIDCSNSNNLFEQAPATTLWDQRTHPFSYRFKTYTHLPLAADHVEDSAGPFQLTMYNARRPDLKLTANSIQEGYGDKVTWPVQLCSKYTNVYYASDALNTWVAFELKNDDASTVLEGATDENDIPLEVIFYGPKDSMHPKGRYMFIKMDTIKLTSCTQIKITASYKNCEPDKLQDVNVYASWDLYSYPDVSNYTGSMVNHRASCEGLVLPETASIKYKTAALQWEITKNSPDKVDLCTQVPFYIDLASTQYADMRDLKLKIDLPAYSSFDSSVPPQFYYPFTESAKDIPAEAYLSENGKIIGWDIAKLVGGNLPGIRLPANKIRLAFNLNTSCGFDPGLPIKYTVNGYTNCGDYVEFVDQRKIKLQGISYDSLDLKLSAPTSLLCNRDNTISLTLKNFGPFASTQNQLEIILPLGTQYKEVLQSDLSPPVVVDTNGQVKLQWTLPQGYLNPAEEKSLSIQTFLSQTAGLTKVLFSARTYKVANANCSDTTSSQACSMQATSGLHELTVPVTGLASLNILQKRYLCAYKFTPQIIDLGCSLGNYKWNFGDGKTSAERTPFHSYDQAGTYNVSVSVDFNCGGCGGNQSTQIQLVVNPKDALFQDSIIQVLTDVKQQVLQVSASTFSDSWPSQQINPDLSKRNGYLNGTLGVWRNEGAFVYNVPRGASTNPDVAKDGSFSLDQFSWEYSELDAIPGWVRANTMTQYSPYSYELENRDVLGIYSAALYDYGGHLPSANGVNMRNAEMAFTGFEFLDGGASGNWIFGTRSLPAYFLYDLNSASGNAAVVKASMKDLEGVSKVDVAAKGRTNFFINLFNPTLGIQYKSIQDDSIICKQPYPPHPEWTITVLKQAPFDRLWSGRIKINNEVTPTEVPDIDPTVAHSGKSSLKITTAKTFKQNLLQLDSGISYMLNGWVKKADTVKLAIDIAVRDKQGKVLSTFQIKTTGPIIEGWQQIKGTFKFPGARDASLELKFSPGKTGPAWYDDLRFHPEKGNMKSYVYDLKDYRLRAILDEENFASLYFYDEEGNLYLVKKETEMGIKTISENVSSLIETSNK
jgi:uncharacterized repeat protein (TIGR01451 family)